MHTFIYLVDTGQVRPVMACCATFLGFISVTRVILPDRMITSKIVLCERLRAVTDGEQATVNAALSWAPLSSRCVLSFLWALLEGIRS